MGLDLTPTPSTSADDSDNETRLPQIQPLSHFSFTNGRRRPSPAPAYRDCMKNHAASLGGHAVDGCREFMPSPSSSAADPTSLTCAACGCHRNFHRRSTAGAPPFLDFRHPPPQYRHAPSVQIPLVSAEPATPTTGNAATGRKRFRTRFSEEQREKMQSFSEKLGWRMQGSDRAAVEEFCRQIGVAKGVMKVWMHNNKRKIGGGGEAEKKGNGESEDNIGSQFGNENGGGDRFRVSNNSPPPPR